MRKYLFIVFLFLSSFAFGQSSQDFREYAWGTSLDDFKSSISLEYVKGATYKDPLMTGLVYKTQIDQYACEVTFGFKNNKLYSGQYSFPDNLEIVQYLGMLDKIKDILTKKYGPPISSRTSTNPCVIVWKSPTTSITYRFFSGQLGVEYSVLLYENILESSSGL